MALAIARRLLVPAIRWMMDYLVQIDNPMTNLNAAASETSLQVVINYSETCNGANTTFNASGALVSMSKTMTTINSKLNFTSDIIDSLAGISYINPPLVGSVSLE